MNESAEFAAESRYRLDDFELSDMIRCGRGLRALAAAGDGCMEDAAEAVVSYLHGRLQGEDGQPACVLARCFKTHPLGRLPVNLREVAEAAGGDGRSLAEATPCLTLLASRGARAEWNGRAGSQGHRAIPLESVEVVARTPMIAALMEQMGLHPRDVLRPSRDFLLDAEQKAFGVLHVPEAKGSPFVPAQEFVREHGVRSVLGFGGLLPSGDLFAVILFSRVAIGREIAEMFRTVALSTRLVLLPFSRGPVFRSDPPVEAADAVEQERQRAEIATLHLLLPALEDVALEQTAKLRGAIGEVQELNVALELRVEERTADLRAANEEMQAFSYSVSHDLRAPLRTIAGFGEALEEDYGADLTEGGRDYLRRIRAAAQRMGELIEAMLGLSRVSRLELRRTRVNLSEIAGLVEVELREREPGREVRFEIEPGLAAQGDPNLLLAMMDNLLRNAWKFTGRTAGAVIRFGWSAEREAYFVADNGAGFAMKDAGRLFQAFSRLHSGAEFEGTGVGLATVARVVRRHGGAIWAEGEVGSGATFWFRLG